MNVGKDSFRTPTLLNTREPIQVSSLILVAYAGEILAGGQAFLDTRNSTGKGNHVQCLQSEESHHLELDPGCDERMHNVEVANDRNLSSTMFLGGAYGMFHKKESKLSFMQHCIFSAYHQYLENSL